MVLKIQFNSHKLKLFYVIFVKKYQNRNANNALNQIFAATIQNLLNMKNSIQIQKDSV
jgi:hypothetical protein